MVHIRRSEDSMRDSVLLQRGIWESNSDSQGGGNCAICWHALQVLNCAVYCVVTVPKLKVINRAIEAFQNLEGIVCVHCLELWFIVPYLHWNAQYWFLKGCVCVCVWTEKSYFVLHINRPQGMRTQIQCAWGKTTGSCQPSHIAMPQAACF